MKCKVLRGFCLGEGIDAYPGQIVDIPQRLQHMVSAWRASGKIGEEVTGKPQLIHKGFGKYDVIDASGAVVLAGAKKADAEKELAWLTKEDE